MHSSHRTPDDERRRNLVLLSFDQWRGDWCDPERPIVELPSIGRLAATGWSGRCYASSPQCVPSRLSWTTGLHPSQFGVTHHRNVDLPANAPSVIRTLRDSGWHTELLGKSHLTAHIPGRDLRQEAARMQALGFDRVSEIAGPRGLRHVECDLTDAWRSAGVLEAQRADLERRYGAGNGPEAWKVRPTVLPNELYPDLWLADRAVERIADQPSDRPWFLWISFVGPHEPFDTPAPWAGRHLDQDLPDPTATPVWMDRLASDTSARRARETWRSLDDTSIRACRRDYADHLRLLDDQVGRILDTLERREDVDRTAVALIADHGELLGDGGLLYKGTFLEGAVRVPWLYRPAACDSDGRPRRTDHAMETTPLLGATLERLVDGSGLDRLVEDSRSHGPVHCEFESELMLIEGHRKLVVDRRGRPLWAVDLESDPTERLDLLAEERRTWRSDSDWKRLRRIAARHQRRRRGRRWRSLEVEEA